MGKVAWPLVAVAHARGHRPGQGDSQYFLLRAGPREHQPSGVNRAESGSSWSDIYQKQEVASWCLTIRPPQEGRLLASASRPFLGEWHPNKARRQSSPSAGLGRGHRSGTEDTIHSRRAALPTHPSPTASPSTALLFTQLPRLPPPPLPGGPPGFLWTKPIRSPVGPLPAAPLTALVLQQLGLWVKLRTAPKIKPPILTMPPEEPQGPPSTSVSPLQTD